MVHLLEAPLHPLVELGQSGTFVHILGVHPGTKTTRDLLNFIQRDDESLSDYLERLIQIKAQVPNTPEEIVIAATLEGLAIG